MLDKNEYNNEDEDDDLRSLLSGGSSPKPVSNPHRTQQAAQESFIQSTVEEGGDNTMRSISPSPTLRINTTSSGSGGSKMKKALWLLGIIIVAITFIGPSGLLDFLEDDNSSNDGGHNHGAHHNHNHNNQLAHHGDKHHNLSPPPPQEYATSTNANEQQQHPMMIPQQQQRYERATNSHHGKFGGSGSFNKNKRLRDKTTAFTSRHNTNTNKKNIKGDDKKDDSGWGIREAIDNIDKVFLDNRPAHRIVDNKKRNNAQQRGNNAQRAANNGDDDGILTNDDEIAGTHRPHELPVVHADDDTLPENAEALDTYTYSLPASDALECRASVVAFVINATDVKDECDGLRKAFDKTCSVSSTGAQPASGGAGVTSADTVKVRSHEQRRRRRLSEWGQPHLWNLIPKVFEERVQRMVKVAERRRSIRMNSSQQSKSKGRRRMLSVGGLTSHGTRQLNHNNRTLQEVNNAGGEGRERRVVPSSMEHRKTEERVRDEGDDDDDNVQEDEGKVEQPPPPPVKQEGEHAPPLISLNIPTADKHISETMLNDALLLQDSAESTNVVTNQAASKDGQSLPQERGFERQEQDDGSDSRQGSQQLDQTSQGNNDQAQPSTNQVSAETINGQPAIPKPNITAEALEAVQDAAESAGAIRTAVEGVKTIMNDPKSIEARTCCASILSVFHEHCDPTTTGVEDYSDRRLLVVVFVITVCGVVKSLIRHLNIRWLPEAGGCILVGVFGYLILQHMPHVQFAFDGDMFLRIMVPPIVFEAAVKINKQSFRRHVVPIVIFAIVGTLASTAFTAFILHKGSYILGHYVTTIPVRESLIFGALISSIDPIAVLSVLNNMGMTDTDTIYVLIFGESLLNDGVAIVLFQTLVHFLDESLVIDSEVAMDAFIHFAVVALGSVLVGVLSGACSTVYFSLMHGCQTPMVEVIMFCCWSFIPYYICDMVEWSGIVAIVANGFVMDLYVIGQKHQQHNNSISSSSNVDDEIDLLVNGTGSGGVNGSNSRSRQYKQQQCRSTFSYEGHLSAKADSHVHFVIEIFATLMETAIFAYLGLFLFSPRYHWSGYLTILSIFATVTGRVIMIPLFSYIANIFNRMSTSRSRSTTATVASSNNNSEGVHIDKRMQLVLIFAGLRGAMSFALVEHIPMFDTTTGQGSRLKPELKAMTSASVIFTVFVLGGATSYLMERLGFSISKKQGQHDEVEIIPLMQRDHNEKRTKHPVLKNTNIRGTSSVRQRGSSHGPR